MRAARSQSSCSGATLTTSPSQAADLHGTGSPATVTVRLSRSSSYPVQPRDPHAERRRAAQHRRRDRGLVVGPGDRGQDEPGTAVLHLHRRDPDVERAGVDARRGGVRRELGEQVVEVGGDQDTVPAADRASAPHDRADDVRPLVGVAGTGAVADRLERHRRQRAVAGRERRRPAPRPSASRARPPLDAVQRRAVEQLERRGRGQREPPVRGRDEAARRRGAASTRPRRCRVLEREGDAADVGDRVDRADLVEVDLVRRTPWMRPSASARRRNASCARAWARFGRSAVSICSRTAAQSRWAARGRRRPRSGGADAVARHALAGHAMSTSRRAARLARRRRPRRRRGARRAACRRRRPRWRRCRGAGSCRGGAAMRLATVAAPKPSSMLTTATPGAQEESIDMSATCPPARPRIPSSSGPR